MHHAWCKIHDLTWIMHHYAWYYMKNYALGIIHHMMHHVSCIMHITSCIMHDVTCIMHNAICIMNHVLSINPLKARGGLSGLQKEIWPQKSSKLGHKIGDIFWPLRTKNTAKPINIATGLRSPSWKIWLYFSPGRYCKTREVGFT